MASLGAKVLQTRSVEIAMLHGCRCGVLSTFTPDSGGTLLCDEEDIVEKKPVTGIAYSRDEAKITLHKVPDRPGVAAAIFGPLADAGVNVDMIVQNVSEDNKKTDLTFTVTRGELARALAAIETHASQIGYRDITHDAAVGKGLDHRHRHARPSRRGAYPVPGAVGKGHQYPGDLDLRDQGQRADRRGICRAGGAGAAFRL